MTNFATYQIISGLVVATGAAPDDAAAALQNHGDATLAVDLNPPSNVTANGLWTRAADGTYAQATPPAPTLADLKAAAQADLSAIATTHMTVWTGGTAPAGGVQVDDASRTDLSALVTLVQVAVSLGTYQPVQWKMNDNSVQSFATANAFFAFAISVGQYWQACFWNEQSIASAINAAPDATTLAAINLNTGWPT